MLQITCSQCRLWLAHLPQENHKPPNFPPLQLKTKNRTPPHIGYTTSVRDVAPSEQSEAPPWSSIILARVSRASVTLTGEEIKIMHGQRMHTLYLMSGSHPPQQHQHQQRPASSAARVRSSHRQERKRELRRGSWLAERDVTSGFNFTEGSLSPPLHPSRCWKI